MIGDDFLNRFGPYRLQPYSVALYSGQPIGGPAGAQMGGAVTPPVVTPPAGGGSHGGSSSGGATGGQGSGPGSGPGGVGNAGGASQPGNSGSAGDNAGHPGASGGFDNASAMSGAAGLNGGLFGNMGPASYIDIGPYLSGALQAASTLAPFPYSLAPTLAGMAMRGWNTANTDAIRSSLGVPGLDLGQAIGSLLGLNDYGTTSGNNLVASKDQYKDAYGNPVGISTGGVRTDSYGPFGLLGSGALQTTYTPKEARLHQIANTASPPVAPRPTAPQPLTGAPDGTAPGAPPFSLKDPVEGEIPTIHGGSSYGLIGYRQANGAITDAKGIVLSGPGVGQAYSAGSGGNGASASAGQSLGNTSNASGYGNANSSQIGGATGHDTTAVGASGQLGHIATGGYIPGDPRIGDNKPMFTTPGEFVVNRDSAQRAPGLLGLINADPLAAQRLDQMVRGGGWGGGLFGGMFGGRGWGLLRDGRRHLKQGSDGAR